MNSRPPLFVKGQLETNGCSPSFPSSYEHRSQIQSLVKCVNEEDAKCLDNIEQLFDSKYTATLFDRHVLALQRHFRHHHWNRNTGIYFDSLPQLTRILEKIVEAFLEGAHEVKRYYGKAVLEICRCAAAFPFTSRRPFDSHFFWKVVPAFLTTLSRLLTPYVSTAIKTPLPDSASCPSVKFSSVSLSSGSESSAPIESSEFPVIVKLTEPSSVPHKTQNSEEEEQRRVVRQEAVLCLQIIISRELEDILVRQTTGASHFTTLVKQLAVLLPNELCEKVVGSLLGVLFVASKHWVLARTIVDNSSVVFSYLVSLLKNHAIPGSALHSAVGILLNCLEVDSKAAADALANKDHFQAFYIILQRLLEDYYQHCGASFRNDVLLILLLLSRHQKCRVLFSFCKLMPLLLACASCCLNFTTNQKHDKTYKERTVNKLATTTAMIRTISLGELSAADTDKNVSLTPNLRIITSVCGDSQRSKSLSSEAAAPTESENSLHEFGCAKVLGDVQATAKLLQISDAEALDSNNEEVQVFLADCFSIKPQNLNEDDAEVLQILWMIINNNLAESSTQRLIAASRYPDFLLSVLENSTDTLPQLHRPNHQDGESGEEGKDRENQRHTQRWKLMGHQRSRLQQTAVECFVLVSLHIPQALATVPRALECLLKLAVNSSSTSKTAQWSIGESRAYVLKERSLEALLFGCRYSKKVKQKLLRLGAVQTLMQLVGQEAPVEETILSPIASATTAPLPPLANSSGAREDLLSSFGNCQQIEKPTAESFKSQRCLLELLAILCAGDKTSQKHFRKGRGIDWLLDILREAQRKRKFMFPLTTHFASTSLNHRHAQNDLTTAASSASESVQKQQKLLIAAAVDCLWRAVVGSRKSEARFVDQDGVAMLLACLFENSGTFTSFSCAPGSSESAEAMTHFVHRLVLSCLADLAENKAATVALQYWSYVASEPVFAISSSVPYPQSEFRGATRLLLGLWTCQAASDLSLPAPMTSSGRGDEEYQKESRNEDPCDILMRNSFDFKNDSSEISQGIPHDLMNCLSSRSADKRETEFAGLETSEKCSLSYCSPPSRKKSTPLFLDLRAPIYATLLKLTDGFNFHSHCTVKPKSGDNDASLPWCHHRDFNTTDFCAAREWENEDIRSQLETVRRYPSHQFFQAWTNLKHRLETRAIQPTTEDFEWIACETEKCRLNLENLSHTKQSLHAEKESKAQLQLQTFFEDFIRDFQGKNHSPVTRGEESNQKIHNTNDYSNK